MPYHHSSPRSIVGIWTLQEWTLQCQEPGISKGASLGHASHGQRNELPAPDGDATIPEHILRPTPGGPPPPYKEHDFVQPDVVGGDSFTVESFLKTINPDLSHLFSAFEELGISSESALQIQALNVKLDEILITLEIRVSYEFGQMLGGGEVIGKLETLWNELLDHVEPFESYVSCDVVVNGLWDTDFQGNNYWRRAECSAHPDLTIQHMSEFHYHLPSFNFEGLGYDGITNDDHNTTPPPHQLSHSFIPPHQLPYSFFPPPPIEEFSTRINWNDPAVMTALVSMVADLPENTSLLLMKMSEGTAALTSLSAISTTDADASSLVLWCMVCD
ncbi:hypothetical protein BDR05DRAFT_993629 [Suillus weaverae]|nr:hypothetical protein BDR05DRAFT_993629 [Suillus weaverae]